jgi:hypothetical protein
LVVRPRLIFTGQKVTATVVVCFFLGGHIFISPILLTHSSTLLPSLPHSPFYSFLLDCNVKSRREVSDEGASPTSDDSEGDEVTLICHNNDCKRVHKFSMAYFKTIEDKSRCFTCAVNRSTNVIFKCKKKSENGEDEEEDDGG